LLNFKVPGCNCSGSIPPNQSAPSVAAWGRFVLVSWYDWRYRCLPAGQFPAQSIGYSTDHGATFRDAGLLFGPPGFLFFGDPAVSVNPKTGDFYVVGYRRPNGSNPNGVLAAKGHFEADSFKVDVRVTAGIASAGETYERPWVAADSVSGRVHVIWTTYTGSGDSEIEYQGFDANLNPIGSSQVLDEAEYGVGYAVQNPYDAVGPSGELYIGWSTYTNNFEGNPCQHRVVRSDDFGATFSPIQIASSLEVNTLADPPGSTRPYGASDLSIAVDASHGPHRGRVYLVWDESVQYHDAPFGAGTAVVEQENNGSFANANVFTVGGKLRGSTAPGDRDFYRFSGSHGQTLVIRPDTVATAGALRVISDSPGDTASVSTYRTIAYSLGDGLVVGLPYDGNYYLMVDNANGSGGTGSYVYSIAFDTPTTGDVARDPRDQMVGYSDDGIHWSGPVRINDSAPGIDGCFPSVSVDERGRVHCSWLDFRASSRGDLSDAFTASSGDGGATWGANRRLSDASSHWDPLKSCTVYNLGTYQQMVAEGDYVYAVWPDARLGDTDVFVDATRRASSASSPPSATIPGGSDTALPFSLTNEGSIDTPLAWQLVDEAGWLTGAAPGVSGTQTLAAGGGTVTISATFHPPLGCGGDSSVVRFITHDPFVPGYYDTSATTLRCGGATAVSPPQRFELSFRAPWPSPTRGSAHLGYSLAHLGLVRLELFAVNGTRVRVLDSGIREAGPHQVTWDGRDGSGREVASGAYFARLMAEGQTIRRAVIVLR
jgi:hypothetical protein